jgi:FMN phosphatase YigB (HAD superfamily)
MTFKILSDFDGVWTDQTIEAESITLFMAAELARLANRPSNRVLADVRSFAATAAADPGRHGWNPGGRITAYVDEDPFCVPNSATLAMERDGGEVAQGYVDAMRAAGFADGCAFADHCFFSASAAYKQAHPPAMVPGARDALVDLKRTGAEVVVVSNSSAEKLLSWFRSTGVDAREEAGGELRVVGAAGKWVLGESDEGLTVGGRLVRTDRPKYRRVLEAEVADLVIGDVFSLDLALPSALHAAGASGGIAQRVLRRHDHSPSWVVDTLADGHLTAVVDGVEDLLPLIS